MQAGKAVFFTVFWFIALLNIGLMLFLGKRNIDFDVLRSSPAPSDIKRVWKGTKPSVWWYKRDKDYWCGFNKRRSPLVAINPPVIAGLSAVGGVLLFLGVYRGLTEIAVNIAAVLLVVVLAIWINSMIAEKWSSSRAAKAQAKERAKNEERRMRKQQQARATKARLAEELSWLTCPDATKQYLVGLEALPKGRRTVRLRFQATKAKVCRPFAG